MTTELTGIDILQMLKNKLTRIMKVTLTAIILCIPLTLFLLPKEFQAETELLVRTHEAHAQEGLQSNLHANLLAIKTYKDLIQGQVVQGEVRRQLAQQKKLILSKEELKKAISLIQSPDSQLFKIQVAYSDPAVAALIANLTAAVFNQQVAENLDLNQITIVAEAVSPEKPTKPSLLLNCAAAALLGMGLAVTTILLPQLLKTPHTVSKMKGDTYG